MWLFNEITNHFTLLFSSFDVSVKYKKKDDLSPQMNLFEKNNDYISEKYVHLNKRNPHFDETKTVNRIKINLSVTKNQATDFLIVNFYSNLEDFRLNDETISLIKEILCLKFSRSYYPNIVSSNKIITELTEQYNVGILTVI